MSTISPQMDLQDRLLSGEPIERSGFAIECSPAVLDGHRRSLAALARECRCAARDDADLRHLLVVRVKDDPDWRRWTPFNGPDPLRVKGVHETGGFWQRPEAGLMGWYYNGLGSKPDAQRERAYRRIATETVRIVAGMLGMPTDFSLHAAVQFWTLELYRSAWRADSVISAPRSFQCGVASIPWEHRDGLEHATQPTPAHNLMAAFYRRESGEPNCWFSIIEPDLLRASAAKIDAMLGVLDEASVLAARPWRSGHWFDVVTDARLTADRLLKAQRSKGTKVIARKVGEHHEYEVASVCAYAPDHRAQILGALNAELGRG